MTDLETRLRDAYEAATQSVEPVDRLDELPSAIL